MAFSTVILENQTAGDLFFQFAGVLIPASGSVVFENTIADLQEDLELRQAILDGSVLVNDGTATLSQEASLAVVTGPVSAVDLDSVNAAFSTWSTFATVFTKGAAVSWKPHLRFKPNRDFYSLSGTEVKFVRPGIYRVSVSITANMSSAGTASTAEHALQINTVTVDGGLMYTFHNDTETGRSTASRSFNLPVNEGDVFRVFSQRLAGTGGLSFTPNACTLDINFVRSSSRP